MNFKKKLDELNLKHSKSHFRSISNGELKPIQPISSISNMGILNSSIKDIWITGGSNMLPITLKPFRNYIHHCITSQNQLNIVLTYLYPGCDNDFIEKMKFHFNFFLNNLENILNLKILNSSD